MARFLSIVVLVIIAGLSYLAIRYAKDSYMVLPASGQPETALENEINNESDYQNWAEFSPPAGIFKVLMPSKPQHVSDKSNDPKTKMKRIDDVYIAEKKNGSVFMIHFITYQDQQKAFAAEDELLQDLMQDMLSSNPNNKLIDSKPALYKGRRALDFVIENDTFNYDFRTFVSGNTLVVLSGISKKSLHNKKDFEIFINSFELTPPDQNILK